MLKIYVSFAEASRLLEVNIHPHMTVGELKKIVQKSFKIDTRTTLGCKSVKQILLEYSKLKCEMNDDWVLGELSIPSACILKCRIVEHKNPDFQVFLKFHREWTKIYDAADLDLTQCHVLELRVWLSRRYGLPLSIFRLKGSVGTRHVDLFDDRLLTDYKLDSMSFHLETWSGWDNLIKYAMKGYVNQMVECLSQDEFIRQFQLQVALYIAAFYGNTQLIDVLISMGARSERPVGEHPCRQWCKTDYSQRSKPSSTRSSKSRIDQLKLEHLKCPLHVAIENGQTRALTLMVKRDPQILEHRDSYGLTPLRLALRNRHKDEVKRRKQREVARYLMSQQFDHKVSVDPNISATVMSHLMIYKVKCWAERARERVLVIYGLSKSSMPKRKILLKTGLVGNKVLVDGFNNNFKDYPHSFERLRSRYRFYYFIDNDDRNRNGLAEIYFRSVGLFQARSESRGGHRRVGLPSSSATELGLNRSFRGYVKRSPKVLARWKRTISLVMSLRVKVKCYKTFVKLGVRINLAGMNLAEIPYFAADWKEIKRFNLELFESPKEIQQQQKRKKPENVDTPGRISRTRISQDVFSASVVYFQEQLKLARRTSQMTRTFSTSSGASRTAAENLIQTCDPTSREKFIRAAVDEYRKVYRSDEPPLKESAALIFNQVNRLSRSKSCLQKVDFGARIATAKVKRSLEQRRIHTAKA